MGPDEFIEFLRDIVENYDDAVGYTDKQIAFLRVARPEWSALYVSEAFGGR